MEPEITQPFLDFWRRLDAEQLAAGEPLAGFLEAWDAYRSFLALVDQETLQRFLEHAAHGSKYDA